MFKPGDRVSCPDFGGLTIEGTVIGIAETSKGVIYSKDDPMYAIRRDDGRNGGTDWRAPAWVVRECDMTLVGILLKTFFD